MYWNKDAHACALIVCGMCAGTGEHGLVCLCLHACSFLACVSMGIIMCVFYGLCAVVCVGCCAHPCELLGVSGSCPSSLHCSPRSLLLASLSSVVLLRCHMLCVQFSFTLFYCNLFNSIDTTITAALANVYYMIQIIFGFNCSKLDDYTAVKINSWVLIALFLFLGSHNSFLLFQ